MRNRIVVGIAFVVQITTIFLLFPVFKTTVFAISSLPAGAVGWLYGRKWGLIFGIISVVVSIICQALLGALTPPYISPALFGGPMIILIGAAFGHLRDVGQQSKIAALAILDAEETKRKLEQQLQQSQKMEAVGTLAGGVAHDMNNILAIIMSSLSVLKSDVATRNCDETDIDNAQRACRRGRELTRNLLGFARKGTFVKQTLNLNEVLDDALKLIAPALSKNIRVESAVSPGLIPIYGDRSQIEQALINICINAAESIAGKGAIRIRTWNAGPSDQELLTQYGMDGGDAVLVRISDTGHGMDEAVLHHVFEPFFTTKNPGKGTGLGLAMAYGTLKKHDGAIDLMSTPGEGTTITLIFPGAPDAVFAKPETVQEKRSPEGPRGKILLVDDEPLILKSCRRMLLRLGYETTTASNGEEAVRIFKEDPTQFDAVILDFIMPGLDGGKTFAQLQQTDPQVRVILSSGYSKDGHIEEVLQNGAAGFIQKPFDIDQIAEMMEKGTPDREFPSGR